jgi:hypothetical protein
MAAVDGKEISRCLVLISLIALSGCTTTNLWSWADEHPHLDFDEAGPVALSTADRNPVSFIVLEYRDRDFSLHDTSSLRDQIQHRAEIPTNGLLIPLDAEGMPPGTLIFRGRARTTDELWNGVSPSQRRAIFTLFHVSMTGHATTQQFALNQKSRSCYSDESYLEYLRQAPGWMDYRSNRLSAIAIHVERGNVTLVDVFREDKIAALPANATIILVPEYFIPDDPHRLARITTAIVWTPGAVALDALGLITAPIWVPYYVYSMTHM